MKLSLVSLLLIGLPVVGMAEDPSIIRLAGNWQTAITIPLVRGATQAAVADPGISQAAKAIAEGQDPPAADIQTRPLPQSWATYGEPWASIDGEAVFWRTVQVPVPGDQPWELCLSSIDDFDTTWVNGVVVGSTDNNQPGFWAFRRVYTIPPGLLKAGNNRIVIRMFDQCGDGGFTGRAKELQLRPKVTK